MALKTFVIYLFLLSQPDENLSVTSETLVSAIDQAKAIFAKKSRIALLCDIQNSRYKFLRGCRRRRRRRRVASSDSRFGRRRRRRRSSGSRSGEPCALDTDLHTPFKVCSRFK